MTKKAIGVFFCLFTVVVLYWVFVHSRTDFYSRFVRPQDAKSAAERDIRDEMNRQLREQADAVVARLRKQGLSAAEIAINSEYRKAVEDVRRAEKALSDINNPPQPYQPPVQQTAPVFAQPAAPPVQQPSNTPPVEQPIAQVQTEKRMSPAEIREQKVKDALSRMVVTGSADRDDCKATIIQYLDFAPDPQSPSYYKCTGNVNNGKTSLMLCDSRSLCSVPPVIMQTMPRDPADGEEGSASTRRWSILNLQYPPGQQESASDQVVVRLKNYGKNIQNQSARHMDEDMSRTGSKGPLVK